MATSQIALLSPEQYLDIENKSFEKHEFLGGQMWSMAGASYAHNRLSVRILTALEQRLRGSRCATCTSDQRIYVPATGLFAYPDVSVICGPPQFAPFNPRETAINPALIVEVLSPSTEYFDRGGKLRNYELIETLRDYLLISQSEPLIEYFSRLPGANWTLAILRANDEIRIDSLKVVIPVNEIYEGIQLNPRKFRPSEVNGSASADGVELLA